MEHLDRPPDHPLINRADLPKPLACREE